MNWSGPTSFSDYSSHCELLGHVLYNYWVRNVNIKRNKSGTFALKDMPFLAHLLIICQG